MVTDKQRIFLQAYDPCHQALTRYCSALAFGKMEVEDLLQEVILSTYQHFEHIRKKDELLHYMIRAARNISIKHFRQEERSIKWLEKQMDRFHYHETGPDVLVDIHLMYRALQQLPSSQREAILLFEICGLKMKEIALIQDKSEAAIKMTISRGRAKLRKLLSEDSNEYRSLSLLVLPFRPPMESDVNSLLHTLREHLPTISQESCCQFVLGMKASNGLTPSLTTWASSKLVGSIASVMVITAMVGILSQDSPSSESLLSIESIPLSPVSWVVPETSFFSRVIGKPDGLPPLKHMAKKAVGHIQGLSQTPDSIDSIYRGEVPELFTSLDESYPDTPVSSLFTSVGTIPKDASTSLFSEEDSINIPSLSPQNPVQRKSFSPNSCDPKWIYSGNMLGLKSKMLSKLKNDGIIPSKKGKMRMTFMEKESEMVPVIRFSSETHSEEERPLPVHLRTKYQWFLEQSKVNICAERIIEITPKYIVVGRLTEEGIKGHVKGTVNMLDLRQ